MYERRGVALIEHFVMGATARAVVLRMCTINSRTTMTT